MDVPKFTPSRQFLGARSNMWFGTEAQGTGYYRDDMRSTLEAASNVTVGGGLRTARATVLALDELVPTRVRGTPIPGRRIVRLHGLLDVCDAGARLNCTRSMDDAFQHRAQRREGRSTGSRLRGKRKKGMRAMAAAAFIRSVGRDADTVAEICAGAVANIEGVESDAHRAFGMWAIDGINPNAWAAGCGYLERTTADAVLVQEARRLPGPQVRTAERAASRRGWSATLEGAVPPLGGNGPARGGTAVCVKACYGLARPQVAATEPELASRFSIAHWGGYIKGGVHLASLYLHTAEGLSQRNMDLLHAVARVLSGLSGMWVPQADFQVTAAVLASCGWLGLVGGVAFTTARPTSGKSSL